MYQLNNVTLMGAQAAWCLLTTLQQCTLQCVFFILMQHAVSVADFQCSSCYMCVVVFKRVTSCETLSFV